MSSALAGLRQLIDAECRRARFDARPGGAAYPDATRHLFLVHSSFLTLSSDEPAEDRLVGGLVPHAPKDSLKNVYVVHICARLAMSFRGTGATSAIMVRPTEELQHASRT